MSKVLCIIDMQNDFITGALGSEQAKAIVPTVQAIIQEALDETDTTLLFTKDTRELLGNSITKLLASMNQVSFFYTG